MNGPKTDFLLASSSFLMGVGSVVNIDGNLYDYNSSDNPDDAAIFNDWLMVGKDIRESMSEVKVDCLTD